MKRRMIVVTIGALLLCAASAAFAGGSKESAGQGSMEDGPATITFWAWATTDKQEIINRALSEFHEGQNDVEVEFQAFPSGGYEEKILSAVASDTAPDVSFTKISFGQRFASENILTNMNNLGAEEMLDNILESSLAYGQYDGGTYMLPVNADNRFIAYNGDVLSEAGYTEEVQQGAVSWDQLRQMAADVSERDNQGNVRRIGFYVSPSWGGGWADFLYTAGGQLLNDNNTEAAFNTEAGLEALRLVLDLKEYSSQLQDEDAPFYNGNVAMIKKGSWDLPRFPREMPNTDWGIMPIPSPTGEVARGAGSLLAGIDIGIYESSQHKEASFELVQHFLSDSVQSWFPAEYGQFPVVESAYDTEDFQSYLDENPAYAKAAEWMQYTWPLPLIPEWSQISETLNTHIEQAWFDELSPEEALNQAEQEVNQILSE